MHKRLRTQIEEQKEEIKRTKQSISNVANSVKEDQSTSDYLAIVWNRLEELEKNYENLEKSCLAQLNKVYSNPVFLRLAQHKPLKINRRNRRGMKNGNQVQTQTQPTAPQQQQVYSENILTESKNGFHVYNFRAESIYPYNDSIFN